MRKVTVAFVPGDGRAPEMMEVAWRVTQEAAKMDNFELVREIVPMGWCCLEPYGDTLPPASLKRAKELGIVFFGGVGDTELDKTLGRQHPLMKPERRCLLALRKELGLLLNFRPMVFHKELDSIARILPRMIPAQGILQVDLRFLLEDSYFGNEDLWELIPVDVRLRLGMKRGVGEVTGDEDIVTDLAYYRRSTVEEFMRAAFAYAREFQLPLTCIHKANVLPRYALFLKVAQRISQEFPDVKFSDMLVDNANSQGVTPAVLQGVVAGGNEHIDITSDLVAAAVGSMGLMYSSALNPKDKGKAMFESGAGTACSVEEDMANPIGRILTGAMLLRHIGALTGALAIEAAVGRVLQFGYRTADLMSKDDDSWMLLGTQAMGDKILEFMAQVE